MGLVPLIRSVMEAFSSSFFVVRLSHTVDVSTLAAVVCGLARVFGDAQHTALYSGGYWYS